MKIVGISRNTQFSPNSIEKDRAIFECVASVLLERGCDVKCYTEEEFLTHKPTADVLFSMARNAETIRSLTEIEKQGTTVVNSASGVEACSRYRLTQKLLHQGLSHPRSWLIELQSVAVDTSMVEFPCWVKRGDGYAEIKHDICYVENRFQLQGVLDEFIHRSVCSVVINKHLEGDLVKFYRVADTPFFYWIYPPIQQSKFGLEIINGAPQGYSFDTNLLKTEGDKIAHLLNVPVYGGDAIVMPDGSVTIIDFNDWPSFSTCRCEASEAIAQYLLNLLHKLKIKN